MPEVRDHLAIALDTDDLVEAMRLAKAVQPWFGVAKVGLELFCAEGPDAVTAFNDMGFKVFLDVKLHDIPTTVHRAAHVLGALGPAYVTLHAQPGPVTLRAGVDGLTDGAAAAGVDAPVALAVTVLTSDSDAPAHILGQRVAAAVAAGCGGIVCATADVREAKQLAPRLLAVVPGIRPAGADPNDQARAATPGAAFAAGADLLVVGRAVTRADDQAAAAEAIAGELLATRR